jgi:hypothetical protein
MAREPLRVIVLGPPKCGKTLQCNLLASRCRLRHITLDRLVRWHLTHSTRESKELKKLLRSMNARATSARVAAECLLVALHPPVPATSAAGSPAPGAAAPMGSTGSVPAGSAVGVEAHGSGSEPAVGFGHAVERERDVGEGGAGTHADSCGDGGKRLGGRASGEHASRDGARGKAENKWFRKAQEIVLAMLKSRLAPRRRAGDKGWVLEGLPHCPSMARGLWELGEHCWPHVVIALEPSHDPSQAPQPRASERPHCLYAPTASTSFASGAAAASSSSPAGGRDSGDTQIRGQTAHGSEDFGVAHGDADADDDAEMSLHGLRVLVAEAAAVEESAEDAQFEASIPGAIERQRQPVRRRVVNNTVVYDECDDTTVSSLTIAGAERDREPCRESCKEGERLSVESMGDNYRRNVWGILDFFHAQNVTCAMISRADAEADDCPKAAGGADVDGALGNDAVASVRREGGMPGEAKTAHMEGKDVEPAGKKKAGAVIVEVDGEDGEEWLQVGKEGDAAAHVHVGDAAAGAGSSQAPDDADRTDGEVLGEEAAAAGAGEGQEFKKRPRSQDLVPGGDAHAHGCSGSARSSRRVSRPTYMSPPDLHLEISRVVGSYVWGAAGVREPSLQDLALTDPDEFEKLHRLLQMSPDECAAWLEAGDMPFTTTTKEARVAQILGLPLSSIARLDTAPLGGHAANDRVTVETMQEYAELVCHRRLVEDVAHQMAQV